MDRDGLEQKIERIAELLPQDNGAAAEEALGLAVGLAGAAVIAVIRIAEALEGIQEAAESLAEAVQPPLMNETGHITDGFLRVRER